MERLALQRNLLQGNDEWLTASGAVELFKQAPKITDKFNELFGFGLKYYAFPPERLDGDEIGATNIAFYIVRDNKLIPERLYCLYVLIKDLTIVARIGYLKDGNINTIIELEQLSVIKEPQEKLYNWLRSLLKASCEKLA